MLKPAPKESNGYLDWVPVEYNYTKYRHKNTLNYGIYIYVHYPITTPSTDGVYIWVRNEYDREMGNNDTLIQEYETSPYQVEVYPQTDGSKVVKYLVPDDSLYTKRITISSCPNNLPRTDVYCAYTVTDIVNYLNFEDYIGVYNLLTYMIKMMLIQIKLLNPLYILKNSK